eukprot:TRINITY_DN3789_c0_g1_i2.p2 TRINITY_DN3789_c0_g1~~TRINITY_DN3789_c0_g1_i2.p2  ORF type:complete len:130 (+),score=6.90 TRINITY_DN3789_c0_g1_i2:62-451(+)
MTEVVITSGGTTPRGGKESRRKSMELSSSLSKKSFNTEKRKSLQGQLKNLTHENLSHIEEHEVPVGRSSKFGTDKASKGQNLRRSLPDISPGVQRHHRSRRRQHLPPVGDRRLRRPGRTGLQRDGRGQL